VLNDPGDVRESRLGLVDLPIDRIARRLTTEPAHLVAPLLLPLRNLKYDVFQVLLQRFDDRLNLTALGFRPGAELFRRDHLPVLCGREREAERGTKDDDVVCAGLVA
jgi:hypothetical protein